MAVLWEGGDGHDIIMSGVNSRHLPPSILNVFPRVPIDANVIPWMYLPRRPSLGRFNAVLTTCVYSYNILLWPS